MLEPGGEERGPEVAYTIVADVCVGVADCVPVCPTECIWWGDGLNARGTKWVYIDGDNCSGCGACLSICPIDGAILDEWMPQLQEPRRP